MKFHQGELQLLLLRRDNPTHLYVLGTNQAGKELCREGPEDTMVTVSGNVSSRHRWPPVRWAVMGRALPAGEGGGPLGSGGGPSNDLSAGTPLLGGKAGRAGAAQPGEEKAARRP